MDIPNKILSDITVHMKYARYLPEKKRRETWKELVTRNKKMHIKKYPDLRNPLFFAQTLSIPKPIPLSKLKRSSSSVPDG